MSIIITGLEMPTERESYNLTIKYNGVVLDTETGMQVAGAHELLPRGGENMSECIEREAAYALAKRIVDAIDTTPRVLLGRTILDWIDDIPAAGARPVVRGKWSYDSIVFTDVDGVSRSAMWGYKCSACDGMSSFESRYCPSCGADMRPPEEAE